jgi:hypothetical protein
MPSTYEEMYIEVCCDGNMLAFILSRAAKIGKF